MKSRQDEKKKCRFGISREGAKIPLATIPTTNDAINGRFAHELTRAIVMNYRCDAARCRDSPAIPSLPPSHFTPLPFIVMCDACAWSRDRHLLFMRIAHAAPALSRSKKKLPTRLYYPPGLSVKWRKRRFPEKKSDGRSAAEIRHDKYNRGSRWSGVRRSASRFAWLNDIQKFRLR